MIEKIKKHCECTEDDILMDCATFSNTQIRTVVEQLLSVAKRKLIVYCRIEFISSASMQELVKTYVPTKVLLQNSQYVAVIWDVSGHKNFTTLVEWI